jgi:hypothetical protein
VAIDPMYLALAGTVATGLAITISLQVRERRWYKAQRQLMESDRPPLCDGAFLDLVPVEPGEEQLWLAVRRAVAESAGLTCEAVYPDDRLSDLWRMQWLGPDLMDLIFRLERILGFKICRQSIDASLNVRYGQEGEFLEFAASLVRAINRAALVRRPNP